MIDDNALSVLPGTALAVWLAGRFSLAWLVLPTGEAVPVWLELYRAGVYPAAYYAGDIQIDRL